MSASSKKQLRKEQNAQMMTERQKKEQAEARKLKVMTVVFTVVIIAIVATFLVTQLTNAISRNGLIEKNTTALTVGEHKLSSVVMNYYLYDAISAEYNNYSNTYGEAVSYYYTSIGLDLTKPLDQQKYKNDEYATWADYYWAEAVKNAKADYAVYDAAMAANFTLPEESLASIDANLQNMELYGMIYGYSSADQYMRTFYGNGASTKSYRQYSIVSATAAAYYSDHLAGLSYDDAAIRGYEETRFNNYSEYTIFSYYLKCSDFLTGGTKGDDGKITYTEEEKAAAREAAREASEILAAATTEEDLNTAIGNLPFNAELEADKKPTCSKSTNAHTSLVAEYADWLGAADRKEGDAKAFPYTSKTTNEDGTTSEVTEGYYILMFVSRNDNLKPLANVRHILIAFEGGTTDSNGKTVYSDAEKAAAKEKAEALLAQWKEGEATEESFIALVKDNTDDEGSKETGGLYEDIHKKSNYVTNFLNWCIADEREPGQTGIVETEYGYHIMYYSSHDEVTYRDYMITQDLKSEAMEAWYNGIVDAATVTEGNKKYINLDLVFSAA